MNYYTGNIKITRKFEQLNTKECLSVYKSVLQNAKEHLVSSDILTTNNKYGSAITHAVLASEEMTKALILFINGKGITLSNIKGFKSFFSTSTPSQTSELYAFLVSFFETT